MKALNRKEVLVNAKANGTLDSFKPLTRDEAFTKKALGLGGGASSWNDLTDKPFGETVVDIQITWDGETDGLIEGLSTTIGRTYKVSDLTPTTDELLGATTIFGQQTTIITPDYIEYAKSADINGNYLDFDGFVVVYKPCTITDSNGDTFEISETGIYFAKSQHNADLWMESLTNVGETVKTLDTKYLPDSVLRVLFETNDDGQTIVGADKNIKDVIEAARNGLEVIGDILYDANGMSYSRRLRLAETTIMPPYDMLFAGFTFVNGGADADFATISGLNWTANINGDSNQFKYVSRTIDFPNQ